MQNTMVINTETLNAENDCGTLRSCEVSITPIVQARDYEKYPPNKS